jgi:tetrahydrodipicolinate N-succinyltransferase
MIRDCILAAGVIVGGKVALKYVDKNPKLKVVKDKICKTGKDFSENCKDIAKSIVDAFNSENSDENADHSENI